ARPAVRPGSNARTGDTAPGVRVDVHWRPRAKVVAGGWPRVSGRHNSNSHEVTALGVKPDASINGREPCAVPVLIRARQSDLWLEGAALRVNRHGSIGAFQEDKLRHRMAIPRGRLWEDRDDRIVIRIEAENLLRHGLARRGPPVPLNRRSILQTHPNQFPGGWRVIVTGSLRHPAPYCVAGHGKPRVGDHVFSRRPSTAYGL